MSTLEATAWGGSEFPIVEQWLEAHRLGIAVQMLDLFEPDMEEHDRAWAWVIERLRGMPDGSLTKYLLRYPEHTVRQCIRVFANEAAGPKLHAVGKELEEAYGRAVAGGYYLRGRVIAHAAMYGEMDGKALLRAGLVFGNRKAWKATYKTNTGKQLSAALEQLRRSPSSIRQRLAAVHQFENLAPREWPVVRNTLLAHVFGWPLLVLVGPRTVGMSVPIGLDLEFARGPRVQVRGAKRFFKDVDWDLADCRWRGRRFWSDKHGSSRHLKADLRAARVVVDVAYAERILAVLDELGIEVGAVDGASAMPYLTEMVLARCLGSAFMLPFAMTGLLGPEIPGHPNDRRKNPNCQMLVAGHVAEKAAYVSSSGLYSGVAMPGSGSPLDPAALRANGIFSDAVEVTLTPTLETLNDVVQQNWRPYEYLGCPEVRWALHGGRSGGDMPEPSRPGLLLPETNAPVADTVAEISRQPKNVVQIFAEPVVVASALWHIQYNLRPKTEAPMAAALSWAFIRMEDYPAAVIWQAIWRISGGEREGLNTLLKTQSSAQADRLAADLLNSQTPTRYRPYMRAPDILVLVVPGQERRGGLDPDILDVAGLLNRIDGSLAPVPEEGLREILGHTRVLLVTEPDQQPQPENGPALPPAFPAIVQALNAYRRGFRLPAAKDCLKRLDFTAHEAVTAMRELLKEGILRHCAGEYHLRADARAWAANQDGSRFAMEARVAAAYSLAPYLTEDARASALPQAFHPYVVAEAYHLFKRAHGEARRISDSRRASDTSGGADLIARALMPESWAAVRCLLTLNGMPALSHQMSRSLLARADRDGEPTPLQLATVARAAFGHALNTTGPVRNERFNEAFALYERAWDLARPCSNAMQTHVGTWYYYHLARAAYRPAPELRSLGDEIVELLTSSSTPLEGVAICKTWAWTFMEQLTREESALPYYLVLAKSPLVAKDDFLISGVGTARRVGDADSEQQMFEAYEKTDAKARWLYSYWRYCNWQRRSGRKALMMDRWQVGLRVIGERLGLSLPRERAVLYS
jgi:hypothetical protein